MREIGLQVNPDFIVEGDHRLEGGKLALKKLSSCGNSPRRSCARTTLTAIGVMRQAFDLGISVPQELSVIGFDDTRLADFMIPPLTTIQMSQAEMATLPFNAPWKSEAGNSRAKRNGICAENTTDSSQFDHFPSSNNQVKSRSAATASPKPHRKAIAECLSATEQKNSPGIALDVLVVGRDSKRVNLLERSFRNISVIPNNPGVPELPLGLFAPRE